MTKKEKVAEEKAPEAAEPETSTEETKPKKAKKTSFDVYNKDNNFVRTYSVEQHGAKAEDLAEEYAGKIGGSVK